MPYDWFVIVNKVTGKKRRGGLMHLGAALVKIGDLLRGEATGPEIAAYDAAIRDRDEATATRLYGLWQARSAWKVMELSRYKASGPATPR